MARLEIHKATKSFGKKDILTNVSFSCETGEILGIFGRNGCGKSTLLKIIFGTLKANKIEITIDGLSINPSEAIPTKRIAYLPQHSFLPVNNKVRDIIPMYYKSQKKQDAIFYDPQIAQISAKKVGELSIGQLRYFQVLLIGNLDREFLLLDEPFSMIDPLYKVKISELLSQLKQEKGIIITDHYYQDVLNIATKNMIIKNGLSQAISFEEELINLGYLPTKQY